MYRRPEKKVEEGVQEPGPSSHKVVRRYTRLENAN